MSLVSIVENTEKWEPGLHLGYLEWENDIGTLPDSKRIVVTYFVPSSQFSELVKVIWSDGDVKDQRKRQTGNISKLVDNLLKAGDITFRASMMSSQKLKVTDLELIPDEFCKKVLYEETLIKPVYAIVTQ